MKNAKISIDPHLKQDNKASGSSIPDKEQIIQQYISTYPELQYQYVAASKDEPQEIRESSEGKRSRTQTGFGENFSIHINLQ
ncbi:hypothetical protein PGT21_002661 [Puccinia graminis f. sp. tritici]|uniref:Uncharacterized protein n=1 Tax=Puccinia graminis f. sp. tritici TaxID=56615 RepID=A0A5B0QSJ1_PUCGR|nr:hypothetical protein PGT21_002661 [Puccinia graminis f. sp. tritici]